MAAVTAVRAVIAYAGGDSDAAAAVMDRVPQRNGGRGETENGAVHVCETYVTSALLSLQTEPPLEREVTRMKTRVLLNTQ